MLPSRKQFRWRFWGENFPRRDSSLHGQQQKVRIGVAVGILTWPVERILVLRHRKAYSFRFLCGKKPQDTEIFRTAERADKGYAALENQAQEGLTTAEISGCSPYGASTIAGGDGSRPPQRERTGRGALPGVSMSQDREETHCVMCRHSGETRGLKFVNNRYLSANKP